MQHIYKSVVHGLINWDRVSERLARFDHIRELYPIHALQSSRYMDKSPFYCHPLAYQLGVWDSEERSRHLDELLAHAATIPGWNIQRGSSITREFHTIHGLIWELQVAKFLTDSPVEEIKWLPSGPDIEVTVDGQVLYIECYCYSKFYAKLIFLEDLLARIDRRLHARCPWAIKPTFPTTDEGFGNLLELIFLQLTPQSISDMREAKQPYIYLSLPEDVENIHVYFENKDVPIHQHSVPHMGAGDTELALQVAVCEAIKHKSGANSLSHFHPNIVAINMSLSMNFLLGRDRAIDLKLAPPDVELPDGIDGAVLFVPSTGSFDTVFDVTSLTASLWHDIVGQN